MKSNKRMPRNPFEGSYKIMRLYCNVHDQGWVLFKIYGHKSFVWEFTKVIKISTSSKNVFYEGLLIERIKNTAPVEIEFSYYPKEKKLYIDRSDIEKEGYINGFINVCINDLYRVERINATDYWIYDLEDVRNEPVDYRFRMRIRKLNS